MRSARTRQFPTIFWCLLHTSLGFLAAFLVVELAGPHNQVDQPTPTNGTQLEGPGRPGFQTNVWWSLTRAGSCASSPVALRLLEPTQRRLAVGSGRPSRPGAAHFPRGPRGAQRPLGAAARPGRRPKCWQHLSLHIPSVGRMFARARRARLRLETLYDFRSLTN